MTGWIFLGYLTVPALFNLTVISHKRKKTINKICKSLEQKGYKVDQRLKKLIPQFIIGKSSKSGYIDSDYYCELGLFSYIPVGRWVDVFFNIKYLMGDYTGLNEIYAYLEDSTSYEDIINSLNEAGLIEIDNEKKMWINDRDNALKELEKKYENIKVDSEIHTFSKEDKLDELYIKMAELEEIIKRKEDSEQKSNDDVQVLGLKRRNKSNISS